MYAERATLAGPLVMHDAQSEGGRPGRVRGHFELEVEILRREEERRLALREVLGLSSHRLLLAEEAEQLEERERILPEARAVRLARRRRLEHLVRGARLD